MSDEFSRLADEFEQAARDLDRKTNSTVEKHATELRNQWRDNARATGRRHATHYVKAITAEQLPTADAATWEIGPDSSMKQGQMSFEYGSVNQPPHLDGARAAVQQEPLFIRDMENILDGLL